MPAYRRTKSLCAYADPYDLPSSPKVKKPRAPPKKLTPEEREEKKALAAEKKAVSERKKEWEATLTPWAVDTSVRFALNTMAMFKSDARAAYSLTEKEMLTLRHECIPGSAKTFFACVDVGQLALRKAKFFDPSFVIPPRDPTKTVSPGIKNLPRRLFEKKNDSNKSRKANFSETSAFVYLLKEVGMDSIARTFPNPSSIRTSWL
ncbi:hypothetical protein OF83DRAFT_839404 [Amylostereum chailletii]|nr:hypothetical protein OF83DRAFT_839404 [Amylostereum chailletii]